MSTAIDKSQWTKLLALAAAHFLVDMYAGMLAAILPPLCERLLITLAAGLAIIATLNLTCNAVQILTGRLLNDGTTALFLKFGLIVSGVICLIPVVPRSDSSLTLVIVIAIISGCGIAVAHCEGLRAIHKLKAVSPALSTAVFMNGGFFGFTCGPLVSSALVSRFGFNGLYPLMILPLALCVILAFLKIELAVEKKPSYPDLATSPHQHLPFWPVFAMAVPITISATLIMALLPTQLNKLGFELTFGGFSVMAFGFSGAVGSLLWAAVFRRKAELLPAIILLLLGLPILFFHQLFIGHSYAVYLLAAAGLFVIPAYPLIVTMARHAIGPSLGQRMGFIVGGAWGLSFLVLMALSPIVETVGAGTIIRIAPAGYLLAAVIGIFIKIRINRQPAKFAL